MSWRSRSQEIVAETLAELPPTATEQEKRKALRNAYPWGERAMLPYKAWCAAVKAAIGPARKPQPPPAPALEAPASTPDGTLNSLLAALAANPADAVLVGAIADRTEEKGWPYYSQEVRRLLQKGPTVEKVAQRLWPGSKIVHMSWSYSRFERLEVHSRNGKFLCTVANLEGQIQGRTLLVDPAVAHAVATERAAAVLALFKEPAHA